MTRGLSNEPESSADMNRLHPQEDITMAFPRLAALLFTDLFTTAGFSSSDRLVVENVGLASPESMVHDADADVCYVSNINGGSADKDCNGFISKVAPDGRVLALKWVDGNSPNVTLHAEKGLAASGKMLYMADIDTVRLFDLNSDAWIADVPVPGATFLNGLAPLPASRRFPL